MSCRVVVVEADGAVGADDEEVAGRAGRGLAGPDCGAFTGAGAVVGRGRGVGVGQNAGGYVDAHDGADGLLEGVEAAGCVDEADGEEHAGGDEDALGPGAAPGGFVRFVRASGLVDRFVYRLGDRGLLVAIAEAVSDARADLSGPGAQVVAKALPRPLQALLQPCCGSVVHGERGYRVRPCGPGRHCGATLGFSGWALACGDG